MVICCYVEGGGASTSSYHECTKRRESDDAECESSRTSHSGARFGWGKKAISSSGTQPPLNPSQYRKLPRKLLKAQVELLTHVGESTAVMRVSDAAVIVVATAVIVVVAVCFSGGGHDLTGGDDSGGR